MAYHAGVFRLYSFCVNTVMYKQTRNYRYTRRTMKHRVKVPVATLGMDSIEDVHSITPNIYWVQRSLGNTMYCYDRRMFHYRSIFTQTFISSKDRKLSFIPTVSLPSVSDTRWTLIQAVWQKCYQMSNFCETKFLTKNGKTCVKIQNRRFHHNVNISHQGDL